MNLTRAEMVQLQRDLFRYRTTQRIARRDGTVTPLERKKIIRAKKKARRDAIRFRHNHNRRRII
jgi:hypothetical protein